MSAVAGAFLDGINAEDSNPSQALTSGW